MKKIYIPIISLMAIIALLLIGLMVSVLNGAPWTKGWSFDNMLNKNLKVVSDKAYPSDGIENIDVDFSSDEVKVLLNDTDEIRVIEYMSKTSDKNDLAKADIDNDTFKLYKEDTHFNVGFMSYYSRVEVYLPKSFSKNLAVETTSGSIKIDNDLTLVNCDLSSSSGSIKLNSLDTDKVSLKTTSGSINASDAINSKDAKFESSSGSIRLNEVAAEKIDTDTTSGSIHLDETITADTAEFESSSGSINLGEADTDKITAETTSGSIRINKVSGIQNFSSSSGSINVDDAQKGGSYKSTSGSVRVNFSDVSDDITCEASSGSVRIDVPNEKSFNFKGRTSSGSIHTFFENFTSSNDKKERTANVGENPEIDINITTTSGSISVD